MCEGENAVAEGHEGVKGKRRLLETYLYSMCRMRDIVGRLGEGGVLRGKDNRFRNVFYEKGKSASRNAIREYEEETQSEHN